MNSNIYATKGDLFLIKAEYPSFFSWWIDEYMINHTPKHICWTPNKGYKALLRKYWATLTTSILSFPRWILLTLIVREQVLLMLTSGGWETSILDLRSASADTSREEWGWLLLSMFHWQHSTTDKLSFTCCSQFSLKEDFFMAFFIFFWSNINI